MGRSSRDAERWRQAKIYNRGVRFTIEAYVPIPRKERRHIQKAKQKIVENLNPSITELRQKVKDYDGIVRMYYEG